MNAAAPQTHDLVLERVVGVSASHLWRGWTEPEVLMKWFTPAPWQTVHAEIDPVPGGVFHTAMRGPDGETNEGSSCVLEAIVNRRFVWTSAMGPGFVPVEVPADGFLFTAIIEFEPQESGGTLYRATARHSTKQYADSHAEMGFEAGWGAALDQLVALTL